MQKSPTQLVRTLRHTSKQFRHGRQEDAHEYARCLLEACQRDNSKGSRLTKQLDGREQISAIFGGKLCSQVKCLANKCNHVSNTFEPFLDLSLEIMGASCLSKALQRFTAVEILAGENQYECAKCRTKVKASKRFWIEGAPNILTFHLKRFDYGAFGRKIDKHVKFPTTLDITSYLRIPGRYRHLYNLYAVLVHSGHSTHSGHYYSYIRAPSGIWHVMDDGRVKQVGENHVLEQRAYMLFYIRKQDRNNGQALKSVTKTSNGHTVNHLQSNGLADLRTRKTDERIAIGTRDKSKREDATSIEKKIELPNQQSEHGNYEDVILENRQTINGKGDLRHEQTSLSMNKRRKSAEASTQGISFGNRPLLTLKALMRKFLKERRLKLKGEKGTMKRPSSILKRRSLRLFLRNARRSKSELLKEETLIVDSKDLCLENEGNVVDNEGDAFVETHSNKSRLAATKRDEKTNFPNDSNTNMTSRNSDCEIQNLPLSEMAFCNGHSATDLNVEQWSHIDSATKHKAKLLRKQSIPKVKEVDEWYEMHIFYFCFELQ